MSMYYKASLNSEEFLAIYDNAPHETPGAAAFTPDEVERLESQGCKPVLVRVVRSFKLTREVTATEI